ncbi:MAG: isoleucine--tRNA ligase [Kiritimatiellae bacterium]|jgi:isoleucyl-tRNA synthetase|nr:isoleucine--tRNA ligase [Kiritimatiellia bacterium]
MYKAVSNRDNFPSVEEESLDFWEKNNTFQKQLDKNRNNEEFVFYDGPPFATGLPHYGHLLAGTIKDIIPRYQSMKGYYVDRRFGWDCHGLPIEALAQEALGLSGTAAIQEAGVDVFNEQCRSMVQTYVEEWRRTVTRMGRWVDFDNDYKTMDPTYMESIWWVFKQLWDQDRIYKAYRIMPYSWKLTTPLSNFEAGNNYKDVHDPAITVRFKIIDHPWGNAYFLAWTTTPWTLPSNLALCVGPDVDYVAVKDAKSEGDEVYLMAKARVSAYYKNEEDYVVVAEMKGSEIAGKTYEPLFPYFEGRENCFQILQDDFVTTEDGTGIVHMAPAYGEDDYRICSDVGIELVDPLDRECNFGPLVPEYAGQFCKDADKAIIRRLKDEGKLIHQNTIKHSYPFCDRTDTPLVYRAIEAWYVRVTDLRDELVENNEQIHWVPANVGEKRFGNWLKNANDWNISRNRFWGSCIPIWINEEDSEDMICVGSVEELEELSGVKVYDLHKHFVDEILIKKDDKTYRRTPEVLDCWFESGSMPYAQCHYPFENKETFEKHFPGDFIAEGLDQTRGWFYTLTVLSTALFKRPAFKNVVVNGLILAEDGKKMSKRLKNYPDPTELINSYGADAIRLYMINSPVVRAEELKFSEDGVKHLMRDILIPLWNSYSFLVTYANIDNWEADSGVPKKPTNVLDLWIRSSLETLIEDVSDAMDNYELQRAVRPFVSFIDNLTNWYIRRSRRRFWKSQDDGDKQQAYATLHYVLLQLSKIAAPFIPMISESIYQNLKTDDMPESVHLCDFPSTNEDEKDVILEKQMALVMTIVKMGRLLRTDNNLKVRQPLATIHAVTKDKESLEHIETLQDIIKDELNVKAVITSDDEGALADYQAKAAFKNLGPKLGPKVKFAAKKIAKLSSEDVAIIVNGGSVDITIEDTTIALDSNDVIVERVPKEGLVVAAEGDVLVAIETQLTPELIQEGLGRELVNKIQNMRKTAEYEVTQRINTDIVGNDEIKEAIEFFNDYIKSETLTVEINAADAHDETFTQWDINGHDVYIRTTPV